MILWKCVYYGTKSGAQLAPNTNKRGDIQSVGPKYCFQTPASDACIDHVPVSLLLCPNFLEEKKLEQADCKNSWPTPVISSHTSCSHGWESKPVEHDTQFICYIVWPLWLQWYFGDGYLLAVGLWFLRRWYCWYKRKLMEFCWLAPSVCT